MAKNFVSSGSVLDLVAPSGGVLSGKAYLIGAILAIALTSQDEGDTFAGQVDGVWELDAVAHADAQAIAAGGPVYWDATAGKATKTSLGNTLIGAAVEAKVSTDTTVKVNLWGRAAAPHAALTKPAATAATNSTPYGYSQAQANAILVAVTALIDIAEQQGHAIPSA